MPSAVKQRLQEYFLRHGDGIAAVYLFGSRATGKARAKSDVDVAVLFQADPERTLAGLHLDLAAELEHALSLPVDLVVLNRAPVDLIHRVLRDGSLVAERDKSARIAFEVKARNEYFDLLPYLQQYRRGRSDSP
ncbi:MAG: nucleotidyltransferase domain-containing protein [Myxococcales bacterium]|nr:nucleotidyltransferase domain-containing protein [Myxococcales bacterium]